MGSQELFQGCPQGSRRPVDPFQRDDALGLGISSVVMLDQGPDHVVQRPKRERDGGSVCLVLGILAEAAGADVEAAVLGVSPAKKAANRLAAHLSVAMLDLDHDTRVLKSEAIGRSNDVLATVSAGRRHLG